MSAAIPETGRLPLTTSLSAHREVMQCEGARQRPLQSKRGDLFFQRYSQVLQALCGLRSVGDRLAVLHRHLCNAFNVACNVLAGLRLFTQCQGNLIHNTDHAAGCFFNADDGCSSLVSLRDTAVYLLYTDFHIADRTACTVLDLLDHFGDFLRGVGSALGQ